jgi:hypothetical protein
MRNPQLVQGPADGRLKHSAVEGYQPVSRIGPCHARTHARGAGRGDGAQADPIVAMMRRRGRRQLRR